MGEEWAFSFVVLGCIAGFLAGLLGISGGFLTIPFLFFIFKEMHLPSSYLMQLAIGTSLASIVFNALASTLAHHYYKGIDWSLICQMFPGLVLGCMIGAFIGHLVSTVVLKLFFGVFACGVAVYTYQVKEDSSIRKIELSPSSLNILSFLVGSISNMLGIGGGTMTVPLFLKLHLPLVKAVASSAATGLIISAFGATAYLLFGLTEIQSTHTLGYIYLPAFWILSLSACVTAPVGAKVSRSLDTKRLKRYFSGMIFVLGLLMLIQG